MEGLEDLDDQEKFGALNQGYCAQHDHLREQVRHDAKIDRALAAVDSVLLDNLTFSFLRTYAFPLVSVFRKVTMRLQSTGSVFPCVSIPSDWGEPAGAPGFIVT